MLLDRLETTAEKRKLSAVRRRSGSSPKYYFATYIPVSPVSSCSPLGLSAFEQPESTMAGQDKKKFKKAGGAKGEAGKVISTFTILCAEWYTQARKINI